MNAKILTIHGTVQTSKLAYGRSMKFQSSLYLSCMWNA